MRTKLGAGLLVATSLLGSCVSKPMIGPNGFEQPTFHYRFRYQDAARGLFLPPEWQLDNFYGERGSYTPKSGPDYVATRELDEDSDGILTSWEKNEEPIYDLRFVNAHDDGIIWIKAHPLPPTAAKKDLEVLLDNYADGLSGAGLYAQSNLFSVERLKVRQFTTFVASKDALNVANKTALVGVIELAESDRLRLDPEYRSAKIKVALARFSYYEPIGGWDKPWPVVKYQGKDLYRRVGLLVVGYYNTASKFDEHVRAFDQALAQLTFDPESAVGRTPVAVSPSSSSSAAP